MTSFLSFLPVISDIIDRIVPDKNAASKAKAQLELLEQSGELQILLEQIKVNKQEAQHKNIWVSGWRPYIGWICGTALALGAVVKVLLPAIIVVVTALYDGDTTRLEALLKGLQSIDVAFFYPILGGLLGLGGLRTYEKFKKVNHRHD